MYRLSKKKIIKVKTRIQEENKKYPSAEFLHNVSLEDYNRTLSNYDKIYDRVNLALAFCGAILLVILSNFDISVLEKLCCYSKQELIVIVLYLVTACSSIVLIIISIIKLLLISVSKGLQTFDSNSIKEESLYEKDVEDASLWVTLQYIRCINDIREKTDKKQKSYKTATILIIISLLSYVVSMLVYTGGIK